MLKKADIAVFAIIIVLCILSGIFIFGLNKNANEVIIKKDNNLVCTLPITENREYNVGGNTVIIENGKVYMKSADCPDKLCVKHKKIYKRNETIVCLPNRIVVEVK